MSSCVHNIWIVRNKIWCECPGDYSQSIGKLLEFHVLSGTRAPGTHLAQKIEREIFVSPIRPLDRRDNLETHKEEFKWQAKNTM